MTLGGINVFLRKFGLVLVVSYAEEPPLNIRFSLKTWRSYQSKTA